MFINDKLIGEGELIFQILPSLFNTMGNVGLIVSFAFFSLLSIAALTSTISSTEVPVAYLVEDKKMERYRATWLISGLVLLSSMTLVAYFDELFGLVIMLLTTILQPLMCLFYFIVIGWIWKRGNKLSVNAQQDSNKRLMFFANYLRYICPVLLTIVFINIVFLA